MILLAGAEVVTTGQIVMDACWNVRPEASLAAFVVASSAASLADFVVVYAELSRLA